MGGETNRYAFFSLRFYPGMRRAARSIWIGHTRTASDFEEMWSGFWTIQTIPDGPSYVTLNLSLVGGKTTVSRTDRCICVRRIPSDQPERHGAAGRCGESGICLPFMSQKHTGMCADAVRGIESERRNVLFYGILQKQRFFFRDPPFAQVQHALPVSLFFRIIECTDRCPKSAPLSKDRQLHVLATGLLSPSGIDQAQSPT